MQSVANFNPNKGDDMLSIRGEVENPQEFTLADLAALPTEYQIPDASEVTGGRPGQAVKLAGLLAAVGVKSSAKYLGLHSSHDDFHASIPLAPVSERGLLIYSLNGEALAVKQGGPARFFIPDHAACHTDEVDECANVKFVDAIEFTAEKGFDNRPEDDEEHEQLHANE